MNAVNAVDKFWDLALFESAQAGNDRGDYYLLPHKMEPDYLRYLCFVIKMTSQRGKNGRLQFFLGISFGEDGMPPELAPCTRLQAPDQLGHDLEQVPYDPELCRAYARASCSISLTRLSIFPIGI